MARIFALSLHAGYRCEHSGACCTAGWAIPVEPAKQAALGSPVLVPDAGGACRYFDRASRLCRVHREAGEEAKPDACRHFPRVALIDDRGTHVTLSHFCPTAASRLFDADAPLAIVESPSAFPAGDSYEGLDARGEWPPLVHRSLLFDHDAYNRWQQFIVEACAAAREPGVALARIAAVAEALRRWTPRDGGMAAFVQQVAESTDGDTALPRRYDWIRASARAIVVDAVPGPLRRLAECAAPGARALTAHEDAPPTRHQAPGPPDRAPGTRHSHPAPRPPHAAAASRFLAAKAFASWTAYQGRGVRTLVAELVLADALVRDLAADRSLFEAIREADRLLVHLVDRPALVSRLGAVEDSR